MREADIGFTVSNRTNENGRAAIFYRGKEGLVAQEGKEGWLRRWEGVCQQGQEQNSALYKEWIKIKEIIGKKDFLQGRTSDL